MWAFVWLEFAAMNGYTLIVHQNRLEELYGHNLLALFAFLYCQSMPKRTGDILESLFYGELLLSQVPAKIANETPDYQMSVPLMYVLQYVLLDSYIHADFSQHALSYSVKGWQRVDQSNPGHFYYWVAIISVHLYFGARLAYRSLVSLSEEAEMREEATKQKVQTTHKPAQPKKKKR